jgi:hypothetical protein
VYQLYGVPFFIWNSSQFGQPLPQIAIDWEDSSADAYFFLQCAPADRRKPEMTPAWHSDRLVFIFLVRHEVVSITVKNGAGRDFTRCSTSGFLPAHASLGMTGYEAAGTR